MPKFSIIVPVYNVEQYLEQCIQSVIQQSYTDWELILVDDGSSDSSPEICDDFSLKDSRIITIHQNNGGASKARNAGIDISSGEYLLFLDSDDFYNDINCLKTLADFENDVIVFGCTDFNDISGVSVISRNGYDLDIINTGNYDSIMHYLLSTKLIPGGPTIFAVKSPIVKNNSIYFKQGIQDEDYDFVLSVFFQSKSIMAVNIPFYSYRMGRSNSVTGSSSLKMVKGIDFTIDKWFAIANEMRNEELKKDLLNYLAFIYTTGFVVTGRLKGKDRNKALAIMKKHKYILKYGYWEKTRIIKIASIVFGYRLFSKLSVIYFNNTHSGVK